MHRLPRTILPLVPAIALLATALTLVAACSTVRPTHSSGLTAASASPNDSTGRLQLEVRPVEGFLDSLGVCTHLVSDSTKELDLLQEAGIRHLRDEISWSWVERVPGKLQIPPEREAWVNEAVKRGINVLLILNYGNPIYADQGIGNKTSPDMTFDRFGRYVEFIVTHFNDRVHQWEVWNEPNGFGMDDMYGGDWRGGGWVPAYARLADSTAHRVRAIDASARVYTAGMEAPIADLVIPLLKGDYDAIAVHPYCAPLLPEYAFPGIDRLAETAQRNGLDVPLIVTEQGYPTVGGVSKFMWKHSATITETDQARFALRAYCANYARGIRRTYWYDFICDGVDPENQEHNFGMVNAGAESPRPAYNAVKTLTTVLQRTYESEAAPAASVLGRTAAIAVEPAPAEPVRGILLSRDFTQYFLIVWKESAAKDPLVVDGPNGRARAFHDDGAPEKVRLRIPAFSAGRLVPSYVDPILGLNSERPLQSASDGLEHLLDIEVKESPVVIELRFE